MSHLRDKTYGWEDTTNSLCVCFIRYVKITNKNNEAKSAEILVQVEETRERTPEDSWCADRDSNRLPPEHISEKLPLKPTCS
jgi:hypothetical protein